MPDVFYLFCLRTSRGLSCKESNVTLPVKQRVHALQEPNILPAPTVAAFINTFGCCWVFAVALKAKYTNPICLGLLRYFIQPTHPHKLFITLLTLLSAGQQKKQWVKVVSPHWKRNTPTWIERGNTLFHVILLQLFMDPSIFSLPDYYSMETWIDDVIGWSSLTP